MEIIKKNLLSVICGVVALLAVVLYFWPLRGIIAETQKKLDERITIQSSMQTLLDKPRTIPVVDESSAAPQPLGVFPTQPVIDWGKELKKKQADEANGVVDAALKYNERKLLTPGSLPKPEPTTDFTFRDTYSRVMPALAKRFGGGSAPTAEEIQGALLEAQQNRAAAAGTPAGGGAYGASAVAGPTNDEMAREQQDEIRRLAAARAKTILFYVQPMALDISSAIGGSPTGGMGGMGGMTGGGGTAPTASAIWFAQMGLWVQADILQAIQETNKPFGSVANAPVKNLIKIMIEGYRTGTGLVATGAATPAAGGMPGGMMGGMPPGMMGGMPPGMMGGMPPGMMGGVTGGAAGATGAAGGDGPVYTLSPTGRVCNSVYDVVSFKLIIHVDVDRLPLFLEQLGRNRFMTAYQVSLSGQDTAVYQAANNVVYGTKPVVQATISGEALMLRNWTTPLMPDDVKQALGITVAASGTPAGAQH